MANLSAGQIAYHDVPIAICFGDSISGEGDANHAGVLRIVQNLQRLACCHAPDPRFFVQTAGEHRSAIGAKTDVGYPRLVADEFAN